MGSDPAGLDDNANYYMVVGGAIILLGFAAGVSPVVAIFCAASALNFMLLTDELWEGCQSDMQGAQQVTQFATTMATTGPTVDLVYTPLAGEPGMLLDGGEPPGIGGDGGPPGPDGGGPGETNGGPASTSGGGGDPGGTGGSPFKSTPTLGKEAHGEGFADAWDKGIETRPRFPAWNGAGPDADPGVDGDEPFGELKPNNPWGVNAGINQINGRFAQGYQGPGILYTYSGSSGNIAYEQYGVFYKP